MKAGVELSWQLTVKQGDGSRYAPQRAFGATRPPLDTAGEHRLLDHHSTPALYRPQRGAVYGGASAGYGGMPTPTGGCAGRTVREVLPQYGKSRINPTQLMAGRVDGWSPDVGYGLMGDECGASW